MAILETSLNRLLVRNLNYFSPENSTSVIKQNKSEDMLEDILEDWAVYKIRKTELQQKINIKPQIDRKIVFCIALHLKK